LLALAFLGSLLSIVACDPGAAPPGSQGTPVDNLPPAPSSASPDREVPGPRARSQTLYVPSYSHIYFRDAQRSLNLTTTLSIRNTSRDDSITLSTVDYYDSGGARVRSYVDAPRRLAPLASTYVVVEQDDLRGGVGANFIVRWQAERAVPPPVVEAVMITTQSTQGISFRSSAQVLSEDRGPPADTPPSSLENASESDAEEDAR
jgi:hypothetical protein